MIGSIWFVLSVRLKNPLNPEQVVYVVSTSGDTPNAASGGSFCINNLDRLLQAYKPYQVDKLGEEDWKFSGLMKW